MTTLKVDTDLKVRKLDFHERHMSVYLSDGRVLVVPLNWYPRLQYARPHELLNYEIFAEGEAIAWPDLDEHIGLDGLLEGRRSGESDASLAKWRSGRPNRSRGHLHARAALRAMMRTVSEKLGVKVTVRD